MLWKADSFSHLFVWPVMLFVLAPILIAGCGGRPWTDPLKTDEADAAAELIDSLTLRDTMCGKTLEADLSLFYENPLGKKALSGFLQFSLPSSYKFVMTNPFGQPVLAIAGNEQSFQAINTGLKKYMEGSIRSFGLRNKIPAQFLGGSWGNWLTGRNQFTSQAITDIRHDRDTRGLWITFQAENNIQPATHHLLLAPEDKLILAHIIEDGKGKTVADIKYGNWIPQGECRQPQEIDITGLGYGTNIRIKLSDVLVSDKVESFRLPIPPDAAGYIKQYLP
jgi:hypothetical protein